MIQPADHSTLLTSAEVAVHLRVIAADAEPDDVARAVRAVHRLVRDGKLRPIKPARSYVFAPAELARYIRDETENFEPENNAHK